jgi:hypothetical protein
MQNNSSLKPFLTVAGITALLLLIPLTAMQFTAEVRWGPGDFLVAGCLLLITGIGIVLVARHVTRPAHRAALIGILAAALALVWAELAVGVFT